MTTPIATPGSSGSPMSGSANMSTLSDWAGPYVTNMMGKAQALSNTPYQVYGGPQTAGESNLQSKVFQGLGSLNFPGNLGQSFASPMAGGASFAGAGAMPPYATRGNSANQGPKTEQDWKTYSAQTHFGPNTDMAAVKAQFLAGNQGGGGGAIPPGSDSQYGGPGRPGYDTGPDGKIIPTGIGGLQPPQASMQPSNIAQSYMNPYLQSVLNPQLDELRRQNDITNMNTNAKMTQAGGYGGGRQAIMNAENNRNLMMEQNKTVGQGYANAYDKAMGQFNTEQGQAKSLAELMAQQGGTQRNIEQEGITADYNEFLAQRDYPQKQVQFLQSMLQGLPISTVSNVPQAQTGSQQTIGGMTSVYQMLQNLGIIPKA